MAGAKGVEIAGVDLPDSLNPGDRATARIDATNTSNFIGPWDDDRCNSGNVGLLIEGVLVGPDGEEWVGDSVCAPQHDIVQSYEVTSRVSFEVPDRDGTHRYEAYVRTANSGEESSRVSGSVDVFRNEEDAPEEAPEEENDAGGWFGTGDTPDGPGSSPFEFGGAFENVDTVILLVAVFAAMYAAGNLLNINLGGGS